MDEKPIYEIHVYSREWTIDEKGWPEYGIDKCVGFYYEKETAIRAVEENWCDLQDHYVHAALIKEIAPGLYPCPPRSKCIYYVWNEEKEKFEKAKIPEWEGWPA